VYRIHRAVHWAPLDAYIRSLGPAAWFRMDQGITVTGSGVSQWDDISGNGRHLKQGADANRPALQADGTVLFNGTSHFLKCDAFTLNQPETVYLLFKQVSWTASDTFFDGNADATGRLYQLSSSPSMQASAGAALAVMAGPAIGSVGVVSLVFNGASSSASVNNGAATTGDAGASNMGGFTLGTRGSTVDRFANIQVSEAIIFPAAHDAATRARIVAGLMARHGVA
jgi:hypothetical protein